MDRKKVLVVEDNPLNRDLLVQILETECDVLLASNGKEGVEMAEQALPDLVLMDLQMPVMNGWDATAAIRRHPRTRRMPVVAVSARTMHEEIALARQVGADDFVPLPIDEKRLIRVVEHHLNQ